MLIRREPNGPEETWVEGMPFERISQLDVDVPPPQLFTSIYDMRPRLLGDQTRITSVTLPHHLLPFGLRPMVPARFCKPLGCAAVHCTSKLSVEVVPMTYRRRCEMAKEFGHTVAANREAELLLADELRCLGARNLPKDRLFRDRWLTVRLVGVPYSSIMANLPRGVRARLDPDAFKLSPTQVTVWLEGQP